MQDLQEVTHDLHYENFRAEKLAKAGKAAAPTGVRASTVEKDKLLADKEAELRKMQDMLTKMQAQMAQQGK